MANVIDEAKCKYCERDIELWEALAMNGDASHAWRTESVPFGLADQWGCNGAECVDNPIYGPMLEDDEGGPQEVKAYGPHEPWSAHS